VSDEPGEVAEVPLSHLSIEVGRLYARELGDVGMMRSQFQQIRFYLDAAIASSRTEFGPTMRSSTCFMVDDYNATKDGPKPAALDQLLEVAAAKIIENPADGYHPTTAESGWLHDEHDRVRPQSVQAMRLLTESLPESYRGGMVSDIELWDKKGRWACPYLASIWQLMRLGMLRHEGQAVAEPQLWRPDAGWPGQWRDMPAVTQLNPDAAPFSAYRTWSFLPEDYLPVESAVDRILGRIAFDPAVERQIATRAKAESVPVSMPTVAARRSYAFLKTANDK
jgi:hypothetical protein